MAAARAPVSYVRYPAAWVLPVLLLVVVFTVYPVAHAVWTSLHQIVLVLPIEPFVGLDNYAAVVDSAYFWGALFNTLWFTLLTTPLTLIVGFGAARVLLANFRGRVVVRAVVILPWVLPGAIAGILWIWVFSPSWGVLNLLLWRLGLIDSYIEWLTDPMLARLCIVVAHVWAQFPFAAVLLMAALIVIDDELYDSAHIDGAGIAQRFRYITWPHVKPMLMVLAVYQALVGLTTFELPYTMTAGGPGTATTLIVDYIWKESFSMMNFGNGAALAFIVVLLSLAFIASIMRAIPAQILVRD